MNLACPRKAKQPVKVEAGFQTLEQFWGLSSSGTENEVRSTEEQKQPNLRATQEEEAKLSKGHNVRAVQGLRLKKLKTEASGEKGKYKEGENIFGKKEFLSQKTAPQSKGEGDKQPKPKAYLGKETGSLCEISKRSGLASKAGELQALGAALSTEKPAYRDGLAGEASERGENKKGSSDVFVCYACGVIKTAGRKVNTMTGGERKVQKICTECIQRVSADIEQPASTIFVFNQPYGGGSSEVRFDKKDGRLYTFGELSQACLEKGDIDIAKTLWLKMLIMREAVGGETGTLQCTQDGFLIQDIPCAIGEGSSQEPRNTQASQGEQTKCFAKSELYSFKGANRRMGYTESEGLHQTERSWSLSDRESRDKGKKEESEQETTGNRTQIPSVFRYEELFRCYTCNQLRPAAMLTNKHCFLCHTLLKVCRPCVGVATGSCRNCDTNTNIGTKSLHQDGKDGAGYKDATNIIMKRGLVLNSCKEALEKEEAGNIGRFGKVNFPQGKQQLANLKKGEESSIQTEAKHGERHGKRKLPRAATLKAAFVKKEEDGPLKRKTTKADATVTIYKYTDNASDFFEDVRCRKKLWQLQIQHEGRPSITFNIIRRLTAFLERKHLADEQYPQDLRSLWQKFQTKVVITPAADDDAGVGFVPFRVVFYFVELDHVNAITNMLFFLDEFLADALQASTEFDEPFLLRVFPHEGIDISFFTGPLAYPKIFVSPPLKILPLQIFEAYPPRGKKIVQVHLKGEDSGLLGAVVSGNTWPFRVRFDAAEMLGIFNKEEEFVRIIEPVDVNSAVGKGRFFSFFGPQVLEHAAVQIVIEGNIPKGSAITGFVESLRCLTNLHFK